MSRGHQVSRRRSYGRRQHEMRERRERSWRMLEVERATDQGGGGQPEPTWAGRQAAPLAAAWRGFE
jgi:hypothetical protein